MSTRKLYYEQPSLMLYTARVLELGPLTERGLEVVLDASPFYPEGGGQPSDRGSIGQWPVLAVREDAGVLWHRLDIADPRRLPAPGQSLDCRVDAARRADHTSQHSAQHLLSATVLRELGGPTRSFHLGEAYSSIDVDLPSLGPEQAQAIEAAVQSSIEAGQRLRVHECGPEEAGRLPLRRAPPPGAEELRIVEIEGIDCTPCCGTHVANTADLLLFRLLRSERYKGMTRIYFLAGQRALHDYRRLASQAQASAAILGCAEADLLAFVQRTADKLRQLDFERRAFQLGLAEQLAAALLAEQAGPAVSAAYANQDLAMVQLVAKACAAGGRPAVLHCQGAATVYCASEAEGLSLGALLKPLVAQTGGRGGGGAASFQAAFARPEAAEAFRAQASAILCAALGAQP